MDLIYKILRIKISLSLRSFSSEGAIISFLLILALFANAITFAEIIDTSIDKGISIETVKNILLVAICLLTIISGIFPTYAPPKNIIAHFYPISAIKRFFANVTFDILEAYNLFLIAFILLLVSLSNTITYLFGLEAIIVFIGAYFLKRMILQALYHILASTKSLRSGFRLFLAAAAFITCILSFYLSPYFFATCSLLASFYFETFLLRERQLITKTSKNSKLNTSSVIAIFLRNKKVLIPLVIAILFKFIALFSVSLNWSNVHERDNAELALFFIYLFASPILIFTYLFNNLWGHAKNLWYTIEKASGKPIEVVTFFIKMLSPILLIDALVALFFFLKIKEFSLDILVLYLTQAISLLVVGLISSILIAKPIKSLFSLSTNTSILSSLVSMGMAGSLILAYYSYANTTVFYLIAFGFLLLAAALLFAFFKLYPAQKESLFKRLFY